MRQKSLEAFKLASFGVFNKTLGKNPKVLARGKRGDTLTE